MPSHPPLRRPLTVVGAPSSAGAYGPGQEQAPATFRRHGLLPALRATGRDVLDRGDGPLVRWREDPGSPEAANVALVADVSRTLAGAVAEELAADRDLLVLGGDCTIELGVVAGARAAGASVGLLYVDLDADLNTPATGDGILDWMGVAHLLAIPGTREELAALDGRPPLLAPDALRLVGTANITAPEQQVIDRLNLHVEPPAAVTDGLDLMIERTRVWAAGFDRVLVHVDADALDYEKFAIAENTGHRGGLSLAELEALLVELCRLPQSRALTLTEINPGHAPDEAASMAALIGMLAASLA